MAIPLYEAGYPRVTHPSAAFLNFTLTEVSIPLILARLACVRHAASVHPEPGSNSYLNSIKTLLSQSKNQVCFCRPILKHFRASFLFSMTRINPRIIVFCFVFKEIVRDPVSITQNSILPIVFLRVLLYFIVFEINLITSLTKFLYYGVFKVHKRIST